MAEIGEVGELCRGGHSGRVALQGNPLSASPLCPTLWTVACQAPLSMGFPRQEYWSGLPFPSPGDLPDPGMEPRSPALQADSLPLSPLGKPNEVNGIYKLQTFLCIVRFSFFKSDD